MTKRTSWITLVVLCGLWGPLVAQEVKDQYEPNNSFDTAKEIAVGKPFAFAIYPVKDRDWFYVRVAEAGYVRVSVDSAAAPGIDPVVSLFDAAQKPLGQSEARVRPGLLYLVISDYGNDEQHLGLLKGAVAFYAESDASEINDRFERAREVKANTTVNFALMPVGDVDVFKLSVPQTGYVRVTVDNAAAPHLDPMVAIFDKDRRKLGNNEARVEAGPVLVSIADYGNDESSPKDITARFQFFAESDVSEPNHGFTRARKAELNARVAFALMPCGDRDTFQLNIPEKGYLRVQVDNSAARHLDPLTVIYDGNQRKIGEGEARVQPGAAYVDIMDYGDDESSPESLTATFSFQPERDDSECNDTFPQAREAPLNERVQFAIMPKGDRDAFRVSIPGAGCLRVEVDNSAARDVDPVVEIYDYNQRKVGDAEARLSKGAAYVLISDYGNDESGFEALNATFHFFPETDETESNDTFARARPVSPGQPVAFSLMPCTDRDVFSLTIKEAGTLEVKIDKSAAPEVDPVVSIHDRRQCKIGDASAFVRPGVVYVVVDEYGHNTSSPKELKASFAFAAAAKDDPRVSIAGDAVETALDSAPEIALTKEQSRRVYRVAVPSPGLLAAAVKWASADPPQVALQVYNEEFDYLGADHAAVPKGNVFVIASVEPARIKTPPAGKISFTHTPGNDPYEPDGSFTQARMVSPGGEAEFTIFPVRDRDFFRCQIEKPGYLQVRVDKSAADYLDPWIAICDDEYRQIGNDNARVRPGTVYIQIGDAYDDEASEKKLKASFEFTAETDASEPNDAFPQARTVQVNSTVDFALMPTGDRDCFRLRTDKPGYLQVSVNTAAAGHLDPWAQICDEHQNPLGQNMARVPAGTLYVVIADSYDDESSPKQLQAQFAFTQDPDSGEPDNCFPLAREATLGTPFDVFLMPDEDEDFYKLSIPGPGSVHVWLDKLRAKDLAPRVTIYNRHQEKIGQHSARVDAGAAYVVVSNDARRQIVSEPVRATVVYLPDVPPADLIRRPGDTIEIALPQEGMVCAVPLRVSDPCYFSVLTLFPPSSIAELAVQIVGPDGTVIRPEGPPLHGPGIYHLLVRAQKGQATMPFAVRVDAVEPIDTFEPNDSPERASHVSLPFRGWVCLHQHPNVDHFRFAAAAKGLYSVRVDHPRQNPGARFTLYPDGQPEGAATIPVMLHQGGAYTALYAQLEPGDYRLSVTGNADADGNANPVLLSVRALSTGTRPPGDVQIMAFGLPEDSSDYRALADLSRMIRTPVRSGETAKDVALELQEAVRKTAVTSPLPSAQASGHPPKWTIVFGILLAVIVLFGGILLYRKSRPAA